MGFCFLIEACVVVCGCAVCTDIGVPACVRGTFSGL